MSPDMILSQLEREEVIAELRDLTKNVDVESISETIQMCASSSNSADFQTRELKRHVSKKVHIVNYI